MNVRQLILFASYFSLFALTGCGEHVTGTNAELDAAHAGGPECTQSGCHPGFGAGGTVFSNKSGVPVTGMTVTATDPYGSTIIGVSDSLGNFYYTGSLSGTYTMTIGSNYGYNHIMPDQSGCNRCHKWPLPPGSTPGRLY